MSDRKWAEGPLPVNRPHRGFGEYVRAWDPKRLFSPRYELSEVGQVHLTRLLQHRPPSSVYPEEEEVDQEFNRLITTLAQDCDLSLGTPICGFHGWTLDQMEALFTRLMRHPYNAALLERVGCLLQSLSDSMSGQGSAVFTTFTDPERTIVRGAFPRSFEPLLFPNDRPPPFVLRVGLSLQESFNEWAVGRWGLNALRAQGVPNFLYVYGAYRCGGIEQRNSLVQLCSDIEQPSIYIMTETVQDLTLDEWMQDEKISSPSSRLWRELLSVLAQVFLALSIARASCAFSHGHLSRYNILIQKQKTPVTVRYVLPDGSTQYVVTQHIAVISDFSRACAQVDVPGIANSDRRTLLDLERLGLFYRGKLSLGHVDLEGGEFPGSPSSLSNVLTVLMDLEFYIRTEAYWMYAPLLFHIPDSFLSRRDPNILEMVSEAMDKHEWLYAPFDRDLDPAKVILGPFRALYGSSMPVFSSAAGLPAFFSCDDQTCVVNLPPRKIRTVVLFKNALEVWRRTGRSPEHEIDVESWNRAVILAYSSKANFDKKTTEGPFFLKAELSLDPTRRHRDLSGEKMQLELVLSSSRDVVDGIRMGLVPLIQNDWVQIVRNAEGLLKKF